MNINFNFFENISKKNVEPIIGTTSIKYYSDKNKISNYFYNLWLAKQKNQNVEII